MHQLGYQFVITPVMLNAITILLVALLFNALFALAALPGRLVSGAAAEARRFRLPPKVRR